MQVRLLSQPFSGSRNVADFLRETLSVEDVVHLDIVVAWIKRSGIRQVAGLLSDFKNRGGYVRFIAGVSQGGATRQGLELAMQYADEAYVFHDPSGRTFHPKTYCAYGANGGSILIGSQNLTRGGLVENYETGVEVICNTGLTEDQEFLIAVQEGVEALISESELCLPLTRQVLSDILESPKILIQDEDDQRSDQTPRTPAQAFEDHGPFGRAKSKLRRASGTWQSSQQNMGLSRISVTAQPSETSLAGGLSEVSVPSPNDIVVRRWYKELDRSNAQRLPEGKNPTGHLTLTKNDFDISAATYFRNEFFAESGWLSVDDFGGREYAIVNFHVFDNRLNLGTHQLRVDYYPSFRAGQNNRTSTLRWGTYLNHHLKREVDRTGDYVTLEALADGDFRIVIDDRPTGPAIL